MKKTLCILALLLFSLVLTDVSAVASQQNPTIQALINAASNGQAITVPAGTYYENVLVNKSVTLTATSETHVYALNSTKHVFEVTANNVEIVGFTLSGANKYAPGFDASEWASGIHLHNVSKAQIYGNTIYNNTNGISLYRSNSNTMYSNTIKQNTMAAGIHLLWSDHNNIIGNTVTQNYYGIFLRASNSNTIARNNVTKNGVPHSCAGIAIMTGGSNNIVEGNTIQDNIAYIGLELNGVYNTRVTGNTIARNPWYGIAVSAGVGDLTTPINNNNSLYLNNFINNTVQYYIDMSTNQWDNGTRGNYWSDYKGVDLNLDGIGDTSYTLDTYNTDRYPLMTDPQPQPPPRVQHTGGGAGKNALFE